MEKTGRGETQLPGSLEPDSREWSAFWHWVRVEGGRLMAEHGIHDEGEWRAGRAAEEERRGREGEDAGGGIGRKV